MQLHSKAAAALAIVAIATVPLVAGRSGEAVAATSSAPAWTIQPGGTLTAVAQNGSDPVTVNFAKWGGTINFDPDTPGAAAAIKIDVDLAGASIGDAAEHYFEQSEQIPSLIRLAARHDAEAGCVAGGLLLQHLPEGEAGRDRLHVRHDHPEWEHARTIAETLKGEELTDPATSLETLAWRLFHEDEVRVEAGGFVSRGCRCSVDYFAGVLSKFPEAERGEMADEAGLVNVDCAFCSRIFPISLDEIAAHGAAA